VSTEYTKPGVLGSGNGSLAHPLRIAHRLHGGTAHVEIEGELDLLTGQRLRDVLSMILAGASQPKRLVLDLSRVPFMDCAGYRAIDEIACNNGWSGQIEIKDPSPQVRQLLALMDTANFYLGWVSPRISRFSSSH
jgi:anti-anti-sigma factor